MQNWVLGIIFHIKNYQSSQATDLPSCLWSINIGSVYLGLCALCTSIRKRSPGHEKHQCWGKMHPSCLGQQTCCVLAKTFHKASESRHWNPQEKTITSRHKHAPGLVLKSPSTAKRRPNLHRERSSDPTAHQEWNHCWACTSWCTTIWWQRLWVTPTHISKTVHINNTCSNVYLHRAKQ